MGEARDLGERWFDAIEREASADELAGLLLLSAAVTMSDPVPLLDNLRIADSCLITMTGVLRAHRAIGRARYRGQPPAES